MILFVPFLVSNGQAPTTTNKNWRSGKMPASACSSIGPVALKGTEIGWSRGREIPIGEYDNLYKNLMHPILMPTAGCRLPGRQV